MRMDGMRNGDFNVFTKVIAIKRVEYLDCSHYLYYQTSKLHFNNVIYCTFH